MRLSSPSYSSVSAVVLFWADYRAKHHGYISFAASPAERRRLEALKAEGTDAPILASGERFKYGFLDQVKDFVKALDIIGLILICFAFSLLLLPITLAKTADNGWHNRESLSPSFLRPTKFISFQRASLRWKLSVVSA